MKKIVKVKDTYELVIDNAENMTDAEIKALAKDIVKQIKRKETKDMFEPINSFKTYKFIDKTRGGLEVVKAYRDLRDNRMHVIVHRPSDGSYIIGLGYSPDDGTWNQGRYDFDTFEEALNALKENYRVEEFTKPAAEQEVEDVFVEDIPVNSPEESVDITYTEKLKGGKNALTYGMIETAFKDRAKDDGKTFKAYIDVVIDSLKDDIANAEYLVSGEMKSTRKLLLEDYVKIEHLVKKAGLEDKLAVMSPLVDELSEKLKLNYWKQPKFKKSQQKQASRELRNAHRWDSKISKSMKPVFLCTKSDLTASYNDAKNGKLPEVFEANLAKVAKDMTADYDRINQGRDTYVEDPRINQTLPEIVDLYKTALKYAKELEYSDYAREFEYMLQTITKAWGLAGE